MKIAAIGITMNDDSRLDDWVRYYNLYRSEIYMHIIIDNNSHSEYKEKLKRSFPDSVIFFLDYNGGCTTAYNIGISHALKHSDIDAIMLIGNDIKLDKGGVTKLYEFLYSNDRYGMVGPVLLKKDSTVIESFGINININTGRSTFLHQNMKIEDLAERCRIVTCVPGGANMSKRIFYEKVGLQDENLFMYCDERDMGIRAIKSGFMEAVTSDVPCWHQHTNIRGSYRNPRVQYLLARNFIYLSKKHFSKKTQILDFFNRFFIQTLLYVRYIATKERRIFYSYFIKGIIAGLKSNMKNEF